MRDWLKEEWKIRELKPHPRNYRSHPEDQIEHIAGSIEKHGIYRNVVVAVDGTILAGHGVVISAGRVGLDTIPVYRAEIDPDSVEALEILAGDNEAPRLGMTDDRALSEILKTIKDHPEGSLVGTGYDEQKLANLVMITRPASEIQNEDAAAQWVGLPDYEPAPPVLKVVVNCETKEDRDAFLDHLGVTSISKTTHGTLSIWWPLRDRENVTPLRFVEEEEFPEIVFDEKGMPEEDFADIDFGEDDPGVA